MKYFSLKTLRAELNIKSDARNEEILFLLKQQNASNIESVEAFLSLQNNETSVFNGWIEQNSSLTNLLINHTSTEKFVDSYKWKEHFLFEKFRSYISPFFLPLISRKADTDINSEWSIIFSYFDLITDEERMYLEQILYQNIKIKIDSTFLKCSQINNESDFQQALLLLLSDDCISIHNSLSRASHHLKIEFIERVLQLFYHAKCSAKLAYWMMLQMEKMNLNEEQLKSLKAIKDNVRSGEIKFNLTPKKSKKLLVRNIITSGVVLAIFGFIFFFYNKKFEVGTQNFTEASSLSAFSVEERKEIDSLLRSMKEESNDSTFEGENYYGAPIVLRTPFINSLAEKIYRDIEKDLSNHYAGIYDTCISMDPKSLKEESISETSSVKKIKAKKEVELKNDSEYTLMLFVWDEIINAKVFSGIIAPKSTLKIQANEKMNIMLLPGSTFGKIPDENIKNFKVLREHFCSIDFNFEYALQQSFILSHLPDKTSRILIEGAMGDIINLTDTQGVLENR